MLPGTDVRTSALGLGMVDLYRLPRRTDRLRVLAVAHDAGITHFDTAPMYGLGRAEYELGLFAKGRRDRMVIATKFGIVPRTVCRGLARVQRPARRLLAAAPSLHSRVRSGAAGPHSGPVGALLYSVRGYDAKSAQRSLHSSLRALGTDYVDLFLLHEPRPGDVRSIDICAYLEQARTAGLLRAWGVAGERDPSVQVARLLPDPTVPQVREDVFLRLTTTPRLDHARITFGILGLALPRLLDLISHSADHQRCSELKEMSRDIDGDQRQALAEILLRDAFRANPDGVVLLGTANLDHLHADVRLAERDPRIPDPTVQALVDCVRDATRFGAAADSTTNSTGSAG